MWHDLSYEMSMAEAIRDGTDVAMSEDPNVVLIGQGVNDPRGLFGTTQGLLEKYGPQRVLNMPNSESGILGICTGAAMSGLRPVLVLQNMEYALIALDQLINQTMRYSQLMSEADNIPLVMRVLIGQNWTQGPQAFQSTHSLLANIAGLKVVMPSSPADAKGLLIGAVEDPKPVVLLEHNWLYAYTGNVPTGRYTVPLERANILRTGAHVTVAAYSHMVLQAMKAASALQLEGLELEVIDMRSVTPADINLLLRSLRKTGRLLVAEPSFGTAGISSELLSQTVEHGFNLLKREPVRVTANPQPTPHGVCGGPYNEWEAMEIASQCLRLVNRNTKVSMDRLAEFMSRNATVNPNLVR